MAPFVADRNVILGKYRQAQRMASRYMDKFVMAGSAAASSARTSQLGGRGRDGCSAGLNDDGRGQKY